MQLFVYKIAFGIVGRNTHVGVAVHRP